MKAFGLINLGILPLLLEAMTPAYAQHDQREQESRRPQQEQGARPERQQQPRPERQQPQQRPEGREPKPGPARQPQQSQQQKPANREESRRPQEPIPNRRPVTPARPEEPQRVRGQQEQKQQQAARAQQDQKQRQQQARGQQDERQKQDQQRQTQARRPAQQVQREYETQHRGAWQERRARNWQSEHRTWQDRGGYSGYRIPDTRFRSSFGSRHGFRMFSFPLLVIGGFPRFQYGGFWFSVMDPWPEYWSDNWYGSDDLYIEYYGGGYYLHNRMHPMDRIALTVYVN